MAGRTILRMGAQLRQSVRITDVSPTEYVLSHHRSSNITPETKISEIFIENLLSNFKDGIVNDNITIESQYLNQTECLSNKCHIIRTFTDFFPSPMMSNFINNDNDRLKSIIDSICNTSIKSIETEVRKHNNFLQTEHPIWNVGIVGTMIDQENNGNINNINNINKILDDYRKYLDYLTPNIDILWINLPFHDLTYFSNVYSIVKDYKCM